MRRESFRRGPRFLIQKRDGVDENRDGFVLHVFNDAAEVNHPFGVGNAIVRKRETL